MDIIWTIFETTVTLFENFVVCYFINKFLKQDLSTRNGKLLYIIGSLSFAIIVTIVNRLTLYEGVYGVIYTVQFFIYSLFLPGSLVKKIFISIITNVIIASTSALVTSVVSAAFSNDITNIYTTYSVERFIAVMSVQILLVYIFGIILKITTNKDVALKTKEWSLIISVFVVSLISITLIHMVQLRINLQYNEHRVLLFAEFGLIILNVTCFYITTLMSKSNNEAIKLKIEKQEQEHRIQYAQMVKNQYEETRRVRHDMKQNIEVLSMLHKEHKYREMGEYLDKCSNQVNELSASVDVGNAFINAIINTKISIAKSKGIEVVISCNTNFTGVSDIDFCNLLGNIFDNAIEGCCRDKNGYKGINCCISSTDETKIIITIGNSISESVLSKNSKLKTTKNNKEIHGFGLKTINQIAEKYKGCCDFYEKNNMFFCNVILYHHI